MENRQVSVNPAGGGWGSATADRLPPTDCRVSRPVHRDSERRPTRVWTIQCRNRRGFDLRGLHRAEVGGYLAAVVDFVIKIAPDNYPPDCHLAAESGVIDFFRKLFFS